MSNRFSIEAVFKAVDNITGPISRMQRQLKSFSTSAGADFRAIDKVTSAATRGIGTAAVTLGAMATAGGAALAAAARPGMDFEQKLADLGAVSLQTAKELEPLKQVALDLGSATKFSATEVAGAMGEMAKAGFTNEEIFKGISGMTYAAAAAGEDLVSTTESISSVMKGMGLDTSQATRVADVLALASVRTNSSIGSLAESMSKVSSTARQLGVPLEDTVAMVALLEDVGLDASEAGTAVSTMLTQLSKPTDEIKRKMKDLGVSFQDAQGNMLAPAKVLEQMVKAGSGAGGNMEQVAFFADLVGLRGQKAAVNLKDLFASGKFGDLVGELENATGTAQKMADLRMDTLTGDLDKFTEGIKTLGLELYDVWSGNLREVVQGFGAWIDANKGLITSGVVDVVKGIADALPTIVKWGERLGRFAAVWLGIAAAVKFATIAFGIFNAVMAANPFTLIALGIAAAVSLIVAFWPEISAFFASVWEGVKELGASLWDAIKPGIDKVVGVFEAVGQFFVGVARMVVEGWADIWESIGPFFVGLWDVVKAVFTAAFDGYLAYIGFVVETFRFLWEPLGVFFSALWAGITAAGSGAWDLVVAGATWAVDGITAAFSVLTGFFSGLWTGITDLFHAIVGPVIDAVSEFGSIAMRLGAGGGDDQPGTGAPSSGPAPVVVSPQERVSRSVSESFNTTRAEVTIRDKTGRAEITKPPRRGALAMPLAASGV